MTLSADSQVWGYSVSSQNASSDSVKPVHSTWWGDRRSARLPTMSNDGTGQRTQGNCSQGARGQYKTVILERSKTHKTRATTVPTTIPQPQHKGQLIQQGRSPCLLIFEAVTEEMSFIGHWRPVKLRTMDRRFRETQSSAQQNETLSSFEFCHPKIEQTALWGTVFLVIGRNQTEGKWTSCYSVVRWGF